MKKSFLFFILFISFQFSSIAQDVLPFVENFTMTDYEGDNQVWSVAQGDDHAMYFANNHYFLRYNGVKWEQYYLPKKTIIRSVFADSNRVYCGSYTEFGFWERKNGVMKFQSLSKGKKLFLGYSDNEEIWKIFKFEGKIYFQSFNDLFIYDGISIEKVRLPFQISYCFVVDHQMYLASVREGIYLFSKGKFLKVKKWQAIEQNVVHAIDSYQNQIYIFTQKNGVFIDNGRELRPWENALNLALKQDIIITAKFISKNRLAIGTAFKGLFIVDMIAGNYQNINRNNTLKNNSVLSIGFDKEEDLWLGLDNGIAHVEVNSPYSIFSDNSGILGSVYAISSIKSGYLLGSNHGLFEFKDKKLTVLPQSQGQVWDILKSKDQWIIGHNDGTFIYENQNFTKVNEVNGGWKMLKSQFDTKLYQANYSGIVCYNDEKDLSQYQIIPNLIKPIKNIAQLKPRELWAVDNYKSLYQIKFKSDFSLDTIINITQKSNFKNDFEIKLFQFKDQLFFHIDNVWYQYNSLKSTLEKHDLFNQNFAEISEIIPVNDDNFLVLKDKLLYIIHYNQRKFVWELIPSKYYEGKIINHNIKVFQNGKKMLINLDDGFFTFNLKNSKIKDQDVKIEAFYQNKMLSPKSTIDYNQPIELNIVSEYFGYNRTSLFYKMNGSGKYLPIFKGNLILNNLVSGNQKIEVFINDGLNFIKVSQFDFKVASPWYFSFGMILVYFSMIFLLFFLYYKWNNIRYNEKLKLKEEELKHQKEILQIELEAANKLKLQEYEKHILEMQVQTKASEVAGKSLSIAKQTEMIESIQKILETESDLNQLKSKVNKSIKINALNKKEWESFEKNMYQSHEDFVSKLTNKFPQLTSKDIKLSIYLKMNLSSKEIAPLMNISYRGVELHRYRLRKKLSLNNEDHLTSFMINL